MEGDLGIEADACLETLGVLLEGEGAALGGAEEKLGVVILVGTDIPLAAIYGREGAIERCVLDDLGDRAFGGWGVKERGVALERHTGRINGAELYLGGSELETHVHLFTMSRPFRVGLVDDTHSPRLSGISSP